MTDIKDIKLEDAMKRLEEIVKELSEDKGDLDNSLKLYEEGVKLSRICNEKLTLAERKIKAIKINSDGEVTEEDFLPEKENTEI